MALSFKKNVTNKSIDAHQTKKTTPTSLKKPRIRKDERTVEKESSTTTIAVNNQDSYLNGIGSYEFIQSLGSGKFSRVMLAYHLETHQQVAIKVLVYFMISTVEKKRINTNNVYR